VWLVGVVVVFDCLYLSGLVGDVCVYCGVVGVVGCELI